MTVQVGDHVREGQPLVTLDARDLEANVRRAEAGREEVRSAIPEADNGIAAAKANLDLAQSTFRRMEELASKEVDLQPGVRRSLGAAEGGAGDLRHGAREARPAGFEARPGGAGDPLRDDRRATMRASSAPFAGIVTARTVEPGISRRPALRC